MNRRKTPKLGDQQIASTEQELAATKRLSLRWPVGGEMFFLTAPSIEPAGFLESRRGFKMRVPGRTAQNEVPTGSKAHRQMVGYTRIPLQRGAGKMVERIRRKRGSSNGSRQSLGPGRGRSQ